MGMKFRFGPTSFIQPNPWQAEEVYKFVKEIAELDGSEKVVDLYGGVGVIGILLAENAREVVSVEESEEASELAKINAELNGVSNFRAVNSKAEEFEMECDVLVVNPSRPGLHPTVRRRISENKPKSMIYVSCNPKTAWRDVRSLGGEAEAVKPFDMLPHTPHIELAMKLTNGTSK